MRSTCFLTFISIAFAAVVGSAQAGEVPISEPTEQQYPIPQSLFPNLNYALQMLRCEMVRRPNFSACASMIANAKWRAKWAAASKTSGRSE